MDEPPHILVTGSTGNVGAPLVVALRDAGASVLTTTTTRPHAPATPGAAAGPRWLDLEDPASFEGALAGVDRVFLMRPPQISDTKQIIGPFIRAMADRSVRHVAFLSLMGVNRAMPHWQVEQDLRRSSMTWTFLRPSFFAQNLGGAYLDDIRDHDRIRVASGRGRTSFVDTRDIAAVAAEVLVHPGAHRNVAYTLTGPEALDYHRVASMLSATLGRPIVYEPIGLLRYRRELRERGAPGAFVNVQLLINVVARLGLAAKVDPTMEGLLGRPATTLARYLTDHRHLWR